MIGWYTFRLADPYFWYTFRLVSAEVYEKIIQGYPVIENVINLVNEFKQMLKSKNVEKLEEWIEKASNLKIRKIDKFVNGLKRDMQAVRNAII